MGDDQSALYISKCAWENLCINMEDFVAPAFHHTEMFAKSDLLKLHKERRSSVPKVRVSAADLDRATATNITQRMNHLLEFFVTRENGISRGEATVSLAF